MDIVSIQFLNPSCCSALLGFVSRQQAEEFLQASEVGTFLIRFSDSELGGVTVAWISCKSLWEKMPFKKYFALVNEDTNQKEVAMLQPFTRKVGVKKTLSQFLTFNMNWRTWWSEVCPIESTIVLKWFTYIQRFLRTKHLGSTTVRHQRRYD